MPVLVWFFFCTLSWRGVRLPVNWVKAGSETQCQLSKRGVRLHVNWVNAEGNNIYEDFIIPRWLSWRGVSLCIDSVDMESHLALTQLTRNEIWHQMSHCRTFKNLNKSANSNTKSKTLKSLIIWPIYVWSVQKTWTKKSHARCKCIFKETKSYLTKLSSKWWITFIYFLYYNWY